LKEKLQEVVNTELEFEEFKNSYNKEIENNLITKVIEKKNIFYQISQNKLETNTKLTTLTSPLNPKRPIFDATIDEHIHPQHWLENPHQNMNVYQAFKRDCALVFEGQETSASQIESNHSAQTSHGHQEATHHSNEDHHGASHGSNHHEADPDEDPVYLY